MKMREIINIVESVYVQKSPGWGNQPYNLYFNPTKDEFMQCMKDANGVSRAIITVDGNLWMWDADKALHSDVDSLGEGSEAGLTFQIYWNHVDSSPSSKRELRAAIKANPVLVELGIHRMRMT